MGRCGCWRRRLGKFGVAMKWNLLFLILALTGALVLLPPQAKADGTLL